MDILKKITSKLLLLVQLFLVVLFIVFEEIIWEGIAKPVYEYVHSLKILQKIEMQVAQANRYAILLIFLALFIGVEAAGIVAGIMVVQGLVVAAIVIYALKIPIAAFTFWLFRVTDEKLLSFGWFRWSYEKIIAAFAWIKSLQLYIDIVTKSKTMVVTVKGYFSELKMRYFKGDGAIARRFQALYRYIKRIFRRSDLG